MRRAKLRPCHRFPRQAASWTLAALLALPAGGAAQEEPGDAAATAGGGKEGLIPAEIDRPAPEQDLQAIYRLARQADRGLAAERSRRRAADEGVDQAIAQFLPQISASGGYVDRKISYPEVDAPDQDTEGWDATLSLTQPIFRRGYLVELERSRSTAEQADIELSLAEQQLVVDVTQAYFDVLLAQDELALVETELEAVESQLRRAERALEVGTGTQTDVDEAQATFDQVRAERVAAQNQLDIARESLRRIIGQHPGELAGLEAGFEPQPVEPSGTEHWVETARRYNLEVQLAAQQEQVARHDVDAQRADRWPEVEIQGEYTYSDTEQDQGFNTRGPLPEEQEERKIYLQVSMPLFTGGGITSRVQQAEAQRTAAAEELADQRRAAALDARSAYLNLRSERERVRALEQALVSARSNEAAVRRGQQVGTRTITDVLNAQSQRFETKRNLAEARYNYLTSFVQLQAAAGMAVDEDVIREVNAQLQAVAP
ncbi:TolC family outer membrane protein [Halorhodospira neutriphila]|uniref:Type I secretion outer membrane protein, TolC family n=1 Tax=Halorhodospira neutriphila TaxID=168379 RepID=A0ABS1E653_9GAMM|nr:TolC family outer membrane protein [Halorhodospira neutriphila]MBK1727218.1 hypothetical protein [Halorhodospira neutriphila]